MVTGEGDIVRTNCGSSWMVDIEQDGLRENLTQKLASVPPEAAKISGPREANDVSHQIWERVKKKVGIDFEQPLALS